MFDSVRSRAIAAAPALALLAAGCGGGSPTVERHPIDRIVGSADTLLMSDMVISTDRGDIRIESRCSGTSCTLSVLGVEAGDASVAGLTKGSEDAWPAATETYRGVSLTREAGFGVVGEAISGGSAWGAWLEHGAFLVGHTTYVDDELGNVIIPLAVSFGDATGTNPAPVAGSATWSGVMMGTDMGAAASRPREIRGDADITIAELANPGVEVAFTNIRDLGTGDARDDMTWSGIPLAGGRFGTGSAGDAIAGAFHGPDHRELGGVFERDRVFGAFGARRR